MNNPITSRDLLRQLASAVESGESYTAAVAQLQARADWDTLSTPKARLAQVQAWCAAIKPSLPKPLYQQTKRALREAALPEAEAVPNVVKFKHAGVEIELDAEHVLQRGGVLANYVGPFRETAFGSHRLRLGFHMTPDQLTGLANYIDAGELSRYATPQQRKELLDIGNRLGMDGMIEAAEAVLDEADLAKRHALRRNTLIDLGVEVTTTVDAAWEEAKAHLSLPPQGKLESAWPLSAWGKPYPAQILNTVRASFARPRTSLIFPSPVKTLPAQLGWLHKLAALTLSQDDYGYGDESPSFETLPLGLSTLTSLASLTLSQTSLKVLPAFIFGLPSLTHLMANGMPRLTQIESFDARASKLANVELGNFRVANVSIPDALFELPALTRLTFNSSSAPLPPAVSRASRLETLDWSYTKLTTVPAEIGALGALRSLSLNGNRLTTLPAEVRGLTGLQSLDLRWSQLTTLPAEIGALTGLQTLQLSSNQLTGLPNEIGNLGALQVLELSHNQLISLPDGVGGLTQLTRLELERNTLTALPRGLAFAANLRVLEAKYNQLAAIPEAVMSLHQLRELNLQGNRITALPTNFMGPALETLDLTRNQIAELPKGAVWRLPSLHTLQLSSNGVRKLPSWLASLPALRTVEAVHEHKVSVPGELRAKARVTTSW